MFRMVSQQAQAPSALGRRMLELWSTESVACGAGSELRIGYPLPGGGMDWHWRHPASADGLHSYRTVLPHEIVFDIGDKTGWIETVAETHALWDTLNEAGIVYYGALSGGRGTHTHLLGPTRSPMGSVCLNCTHPPQFHVQGGCNAGPCGCVDWVRMPTPGDDWRINSSRIILSIATQRKWQTEFGARIGADPKLLHPNHGSQMIREFGVEKEEGSHGPKTLWAIGPAPYTPLPYNIKEAYGQAAGRALRAPITLQRNADIPFGFWDDIKCFASGPCPVRPSCLLKPCGDCPILGANDEKNEGNVIT